jgi:hypothetical protein
MSYVTIIDKPSNKLEVQEQIAHLYVGCVPCHGGGRFVHNIYYNPWALDGFSGGGIYRIWQEYHCPYCRGSGAMKIHESADAH